MRLNRLWLLGVFAVVNIFSMTAAGGGLETLWRIGSPDKNYDEFAIAGDFGKYREVFKSDPDFLAGTDKAEEDWSFIHPGPEDRWGGGESHIFKIRFDDDDIENYAFYVFEIHTANAHNVFPPDIKVAINEKEYNITLQPGNGKIGNPKENSEQGNVYRFPFKKSVLGDENVISITTKAGCWMIYDALLLKASQESVSMEKIEATVQEGMLRASDGEAEKRIINLDFGGGFVARPIEIAADWKGGSFVDTLNTDSEVLSSLELHLPTGDITEPKKISLKLKAGSRESGCKFTINPQRKWEIHLISQTHLDIGYTDYQENVLEKQVQSLYDALDYIEDSKSEPKNSQFKWHPDGLWAVEEFMETASEKDKKRFVRAARKGYVHLDGNYVHVLTAACSEEEMVKLMDFSSRFCDKKDIPLDSVVFTDVPGYTWGLLEAMGEWGLKYLSLGPNPSHRVGHTHAWDNQPFYWVSPSGKYEIMTWMPGNSYNTFHFKPVGHRIKEKKIFGLIRDLKKDSYPYDIAILRYCIGTDNGPPNPALVDTVREWNDKYVYPELIIAETSSTFSEFEERYGDQLPKVKGDFTPYWGDGMASTAADTGINRIAKEKLIQAQTLWAMLSPNTFPQSEFDKAWKKIIMYDEHTWGANISISKPDDPFSVRQAEYKQQFALDAKKFADRLLNESLKPIKDEGSSAFNVINNLNWTRTEIVFLSPEESEKGDLVVDEKGRKVASQRLADGRLAFLAKDVPGFGAKMYFVKKGEPLSQGSVEVTGSSISNGNVKLSVDTQTGAVESISLGDSGRNLVDDSEGFGLNDYLYIIGRNPSENNRRVTGPVSISVKNDGPLVGSLVIKSDAPGARSLTRTVRVVQGSDLIELDNVIDKKRERKPEGGYFSFPFNVPDGVMRFDTPLATVRPEKDQIKGANKNFFCVQRWVDISNKNRGVTWIPVEAPVVQYHPIKIASATSEEDFRKFIDPEPVIHSWVFNNHWETNYKADQEGVIRFRYVLNPHEGGYDARSVQHSARSVHQPLIVSESDPSASELSRKIEVKGDGIVVTTLKPARSGEGIICRLFNTSENSGVANIHLDNMQGDIWLSNPLEEKCKRAGADIRLKGQELMTLLIE